jgi:lysophospholipase L1-like esterase
VKELRAAGAQVVLGINDDQSKRPFMVDDNLRREVFPGITAEEGKQMSAQARKYADVVRQVAAENGALVADFLEADFFFDRATMADDGAHPNGKGYEEMTEVWLNAMQPLL